VTRWPYTFHFQKKHNVKLGFMSFFVKATIDALKLVPQVNAEIREDNIVYKNHYDIAVAIGGGKLEGLGDRLFQADEVINRRLAGQVGLRLIEHDAGLAHGVVPDRRTEFASVGDINDDGADGVSAIIEPNGIERFGAVN